MADPLWTVVRFLHIGSAIALVGGATLWGTRIAPALGQLGPTLPKGAFPTIGGKVAAFLPQAAVATLLTGGLLYWNMLPFGNELWRSLMGAALVLMLVIVAASFGVLIPTFKKLSAAMSAPGPPGPELAQLMARMRKVSMANLGLGWLIVVLMVVATALRTT